MSLARAVTKRILRPDTGSPTSPPARSRTVKNPGLKIDRAKISSPITLISTTNMLSYNAPDISLLQYASSMSSTRWATDSDSSGSTRSRSSSQGSEDTLTDTSSMGSLPTSPAPNHLSGYFESASKAPRRSTSSSQLQQIKPAVIEPAPAPAIPKRALSHSKYAHERLARERSMKNLKSRRNSSFHGSLNSMRLSREHGTSLEMSKALIEEEVHPFGKELEQLDEVVEEFGGVDRDAETEAERVSVHEKGLATFCAADYLAEIQPLFSNRFAPVVAQAWI